MSERILYIYGKTGIGDDKEIIQLLKIVTPLAGG
jgi:hypothetical protein